MRKSIPHASHHIVHHQAPRIWQDGFPIGNGFLGAMVWGDGNPLRFTLDCADLWDNRVNDCFLQNPDYNYANLCRLISKERYDEAEQVFATGENREPELYPTKISIGRAELKTGVCGEYECRLDIDRAVVEGILKTEEREHAFTCFIHHDLNVLCLQVDQLSDDAVMGLSPLLEICPAMAGLNYEPPVWRTEGDVRIMVQTVPDAASYAVAWNPRGEVIYLTVATGETGEDAARQALVTHEQAGQQGYARLLREHCRSWRDFWGASAVCLPEPDAEFHWYYGIYLLASSARRGSMPPGLQGLWAMDGVLPPWHGDYHHDMNVQETFWPACAGGHLDLLDCWCDYMKESIEPARALTRRFFDTEGTFWPCVTIGKFNFPEGNRWYSIIFGWSHGGWLGWLVWLRWRYSLDKEWLKETGYPVLSDIFRFYRANLVQESDGCLHVPLSVSPEYHGHDAEKSFCKDPNIDLALIGRCCDWIVEMEQALGIAELTESARTIQAKLVPYVLTEKKVLCLWPGKVLDESHRHPSHLMAVHPGMDLTIDGDEEERAIINASVEQFLALGQYQWAGHTYAQMIGFAAVLRRGNWAYESLRQFMDHWTMPNGLHVNGDWRNSGMSAYNRPRDVAPFTMEANNAVSAGISDMLLQGWNDVVRVFPAVPDHWRDLAFFDLRAEGAWMVSAIRLMGATLWVKVVAGVARRLVLRDPFDGAPAEIIEGNAELKDGCYVADLKAGESLVLKRHDYEPDIARAVRTIHRDRPSSLGLPKQYS